MVKERPAQNFGLELLRKAGHVLAGILIVILVGSGVLTVAVLGLLTLVMGLVVLFNYRYEKELLTHILSVNRADAKIPGMAILAFMLGSWIVLLIFPQEIAFASIMVLAFGDPVAHLISTGFGGKHSAVTRTSYLEGTIAGAIVGGLAAWVYVESFFVALIAAAVAMFVEAGELRIAEHHIDDNLTIPLVAGAVLWLIQILF